MQISRFLIVAGVAAIGLVALSSQAADTDAQIKAREALRAKMRELETVAPETNPPVAVPAAKPVKPAATKPVPTAVPAELKPNPLVAAPVVVAPTRMTQPAKVSPAPAQPKSNEAPLVAPMPADSEKIAKARERMREMLGSMLVEQAPVETAPPPSPAKPVPTVQSKPVASAPQAPPPPAQPKLPSQPTPPPAQATAYNRSRHRPCLFRQPSISGSRSCCGNISRTRSPRNSTTPNEPKSWLNRNCHESADRRRSLA